VEATTKETVATAATLAAMPGPATLAATAITAIAASTAVVAATVSFFSRERHDMVPLTAAAVAAAELALHVRATRR